MVTVRKATPSDAEAVIDLIKQFPEGEIVVDWEDATRAYLEMLKDGKKGSSLVAEEDGKVLGVVNISYPYATRCLGIYSCIEEIIVDGNARGKGIGPRILEAAVNEARDRGCYEIQVNRPSELGYPMYLKNGFYDLGKHLNMKLTA